MIILLLIDIQSSSMMPSSSYISSWSFYSYLKFNDTLSPFIISTKLFSSTVESNNS